MAGTKLKARLPASTLLEVVIAMVIIILVFGIAMMIFANVTRSSLSVKKIQAEAILRETMLNAENTPGVTAQTFTIGDFRIEQDIKAYHNDPNLLEVDLAAYDANQQKITELHQVIINKNE